MDDEFQKFKKDCDEITQHLAAGTAPFDWVVVSTCSVGPSGQISGTVHGRGHGIPQESDVPVAATHAVLVVFRQPQQQTSDWFHWHWVGLHATQPVEDLLTTLKHPNGQSLSTVLPRKLWIRVLENLQMTVKYLYLDGQDVADPAQFRRYLLSNPASNCIIYSGPNWELPVNSVPPSWSSSVALPAFGQKFLVIDPDDLIRMLTRSDGFRDLANPRPSQNHREDLNMQEWEIWEPFFKTFEVYRFFRADDRKRASDFFREDLFRIVNTVSTGHQPDKYKNSFTRALRQRTQFISQVLSKYLQPILKKLLTLTLEPEANRMLQALPSSPIVQCVPGADFCYQQEPVYRKIFFCDDAAAPFPFKEEDTVFVCSKPDLFDDGANMSFSHSLKIECVIPPFWFVIHKVGNNIAYFVLSYSIQTLRLSCKCLSNFSIEKIAFSFEEPVHSAVPALQQSLENLQVTESKCRQFATKFVNKKVLNLASFFSLPRKMLEEEIGMKLDDQKKVLDALVNHLAPAAAPAPAAAASAAAPAAAPAAAAPAAPAAPAPAAAAPAIAIAPTWTCERAYPFIMDQSGGSHYYPVWDDLEARRSKVADSNSHNDIRFKFEQAMLNFPSDSSQKKIQIHFYPRANGGNPVPDECFEPADCLKKFPKTPNFLYAVQLNQQSFEVTIMIHVIWKREKIQQFTGFYQQHPSASKLDSLNLHGSDPSKLCPLDFAYISEGLYEITMNPIRDFICDLSRCCIIARNVQGCEDKFDKFNSTKAFRLMTTDLNPSPNRVIDVDQYKHRKVAGSPVAVVAGSAPAAVAATTAATLPASKSSKKKGSSAALVPKTEEPVFFPSISMHMYGRLGIPKLELEVRAFELELLHARRYDTCDWYKKLGPAQFLNLMILSTCNSNLSLKIPASVSEDSVFDWILQLLKAQPLIDITAFKNVVDCFSKVVDSFSKASLADKETKAYPFLPTSKFSTEEQVEFKENSQRLFDIRCHDYAHKDDEIDARDATASWTTVIELSHKMYWTLAKLGPFSLPADVAEFWNELRDLHLADQYSRFDLLRKAAKRIHQDLSKSIPIWFEIVREVDLQKDPHPIFRSTRTAVHKLLARPNSCEEGEVFKEYLQLSHHQAALDREIDTFRLFHPQENLLTTDKIVVSDSGKPIGFIVKEMDTSLPNYLLGSPEFNQPPHPATTIELLVAIYRVSKALSALHEKGSTHLDVSPGNILFSRSYRDPLAPNGPSIREIIRGMQVVLSDFGHSNHSQILDQENSTTGEQRGTPAYKSPLLSSHPDRVPRDKDDMFSLGVVFLQALFPLDRCNGVFDNGAFPIDRSNRDYPAYALKQWHTHVSGLSHSHYESVYKTSSPLFSAFPALKGIIFDCLQENEELRPSSKAVSLELCKMLTDSKTLSDTLQNGLLDKLLPADCFELHESIWHVFFPQHYESERFVRPSHSITKIVYTGSRNMMGYPHSSSGKLSVFFETQAGHFKEIYVYQGSFEHGCFTGDNCTVCKFKDEAMTTEMPLFDGEFRNYVFIRGKEYDPQTTKKSLVFEGSKNYSLKSPYFYNGKLFVDEDTGALLKNPILYVNGARRPNA